MTWSGPVNDPAGNGLMLGDKKVFIMSGSDTPNIIYGAFGTGVGADSATLTFVDPFPGFIPRTPR